MTDIIMIGSIVEGKSLKRHVNGWMSEQRRGHSYYSGEPLILSKKGDRGFVVTWEELERLANDAGLNETAEVVI